MAVELTSIGSFQRKLDFIVPQKDVRHELDQAFRSLKHKVRLPGFRPGKVPRQLLEARYGEQIRGDVAQALIQRFWESALNEHGLNPVSRPIVDESFEIKASADFNFTIHVEVKPEIEVATYKGVDVFFPKSEVSDEEVDEMVRIRLEGLSKLVPVERPAEAGDMVLVSLIARDGDDEVANEPGTMIRTEADPYYPGVESLMLGLANGDSKTDTISFADDARNEAVAGLTLTVTVEVQSVQANELPELSDEIAKELGFDDGAEAMRATLRTQLASAREEMSRNQARANLLQSLIELNTFDVPDGMIENNLEMMKRELMLQQAYRGIDPRTVHFSEEQTADLRIRAAFAAKAALILEFVTKVESIEVTDDDVDRKFFELADERGQTVEAVRGYFQKDNELEELQARMLEEKTLDWLLERATLVDTPPAPIVADPIEEPASDEPAAEAAPAVEEAAPAAEEAAPAAEEAAPAAPTWKKSMKKDELLAVAKELGLAVNTKTKKADIIAALEAAS